MSELIEFIVKRQDKILTLLGQHVEMVLISLSISIVLGVLIGYVITRNERLAEIVLYIAGILMTIPSLALFAFLVPLMGLNMKPVIFRYRYVHPAPHYPQCLCGPPPISMNRSSTPPGA